MEAPKANNADADREIILHEEDSVSDTEANEWYGRDHTTTSTPSDSSDDDQLDDQFNDHLTCNVEYSGDLAVDDTPLRQFASTPLPQIISLPSIATNFAMSTLDAAKLRSEVSIRLEHELQGVSVAISRRMVYGGIVHICEKLQGLHAFQHDIETCRRQNASWLLQELYKKHQGRPTNSEIEFAVRKQDDRLWSMIIGANDKIWRRRVCLWVLTERWRFLCEQPTE